MKFSLHVLFALLLCFLAAGYSNAATLTVTKIEDTNDGLCDADCSLREAVAVAAAGDTVVFSALFNSPQTITLTLGQINITQNLTITGTGQNLVTISGNLAGRIFFINGNFNVTMSGMKLRDGKVEAKFPAGGAILSIGGSLDLSGMEFTNNALVYTNPKIPGGAGSAIYGADCIMTLANLNVHHNLFPGDAIHANSTVEIRDSILDSNSSGIGAATLNMINTTVSGHTFGAIGGFFLTLSNSRIINNGGRGIQGGGANSTMTIENSVISGNMDSGIANSGSTANGGFAKISNSIISSNTSPDWGGGITNTGTLYITNSSITGNTAHQGGGLRTTGTGQVFLTNTTVSGNSALGTVASSFGGGIYNVLGSSTASQVTLINSTIANNFCNGKGGGIRQDSSGSMTVRNTIIAENTSGFTKEIDVSGAVISNGVNLVGDTTGSSGWIAGDLLNMNSILGPLADNGGPTMTHALLNGSPALDAGNNSLAIDPQTQMPLTSDQRGFLRFYGGVVDIGAYETQPEITGTIIYGNATGSPTPRFVSGVLMSAVGSPNVFAMTSAAGTYTLGGFGSGAYTVTPSKSGGANGISSFDAGLIARHAAGIDPLKGNQLIVADVSGNGTISSFDAGQTARYTAGLNGFGSSGNWIFIPVKRTYSSVNSTITGEDFIALLMGDVSGNWSNDSNQNVEGSALTNVRASATMGDVSGNWTPVSSRPLAVGSKEDCVECYALTNVRASATRAASSLNFVAFECEGPTGNKIITSRAVCLAMAEARADAAKKLRSRLSAVGRQNHTAVASGSKSAVSYPIMARKNLQPHSAAGDTHREIDRLIGESLADYCNRRSVEDMEKAKARARKEDALRKCLPKEGELPKWAEGWVADAWKDGKSGLAARRNQTLMLVDPADPNVMWKWDNRGWLAKSLDGGVKWERLLYTYDRQWRYVSSLTSAREDGKTILLAGVMSEPFIFDSGIMRSDDGGERWYRVYDGLSALSVTFDPDDPQNAIAEIIAPSVDLMVSRVVFSTDGGKHWMTAMRNGIAMETDSGSKMRALRRYKTKSVQGFPERAA